MLRYLIALAVLLALGTTAQATTYYVATSGNDAWPGTQAQPFATWQKAIDRAIAGDIILISPGTYRPIMTGGAGVFIRRSGASGAPITIKGYGDRPVLDCSGITPDAGTIYCLDLRASWWRIENIAVTGATQRTASDWIIGIMVAGRNLTFRNIQSYDNDGPGFGNEGELRNVLVENSDFFRNCDRLSGGGNAGGLEMGFMPSTATGNRLIGNRAYDNCDDGFDVYGTEAPIIMQNNWSFRNGYLPGTTTAAGDGDGYKLGPNRAGPQHQLTRNISFGNRYLGYDCNDAVGGAKLVHNLSYHDGAAYGFWGTSKTNMLKNNIAIGGALWLSGPLSQRGNNWQLSGVAADDADFQSVATEEARKDRQADGSLPSSALFRLVTGSDLIDKGVYVNLPYNGAAPDTGRFEAD